MKTILNEIGDDFVVQLVSPRHQENPNLDLSNSWGLT